MNEPKIFDAHNVLRPASELAETMCAALRAWDLSQADALEIGRSLLLLSANYDHNEWAALNPMMPPPQPKFPCKKFALEIFQILRIWDANYGYMKEFCGRFHAFVDGKTAKEWKEWKPDIRPSYAIPGLGAPN